MGTRHLTCVIVDEEMKVAQYGQWDGYPEGQGRTIVDFLTNLTSLPRFKNNVRLCTFITDEETEKRWKEVGSKGGMATLDQSDAFKEKWPELHRDIGAKVLELINEAPRKLNDSSDFASDSLFCEWAYVVNLDNETLEIHEGFQQEVHFDGRFATMQDIKEYRGERQYAPVRLVKTIKFSDLPAAFDDFVGAIKAEREA